MARKPRTPRQQELEEALASLKAEKAALKQQQARVAVARRALAAISCCDWCGAKVLPCGATLQLCPDCAAARRKQQRIALLEQHGYGPDGKRLAAA